jgi:phage shock protein PspC (stress-responsive transcriptional regulator)
MTETTAGPAGPPGPDGAPPEPPPEPGPPTSPGWAVPAALVRPRGGRVLRGVCAGLGRYTGTDPVLWRVLLAVLAVFGGAGLVVYLAGWLLVPEEGAAQSTAERWVDSRNVNPVVVVGLGALLVLALLVSLDGDGGGLVPLAVLGLIGYLVLRNRQAAPSATGWAAPPAWTTPEGTAPPPPYAATSPAGTATAPPPYGVPVLGPPRPPVPRPPRSRVGWVTVSAMVLVVGVVLLAAALGADGVTVERVLATALLVLGVGLLVGAVRGRARWLVALAVPLAVSLSVVSAVGDEFDPSSGQRTWAVDGSAERTLGAGDAVLDLRPLDGSERRGTTVESGVGVGQLVVLVPADLRVRLDASVGLGELRVTELDGTSRTTEGSDLDDVVDLGPAGPRTVELDVRVGLGSLEVRRVAS